MSALLSIRNRQRARVVNTTLLRRITRQLLQAELRVPRFELCLHLISNAEMTRLNERFLRHVGSTDVITFNLDALEETRARATEAAEMLRGEIFVSVEEAVAQARTLRIPWPKELVRYVIHGLLHLRGLDDRRVTARRRMKREEDRLVRLIAREFDLAPLGASAPPAQARSKPARARSVRE